MDILGVDQAVFGVKDVEAAKRFCRDYGFIETEHGTAGASFETLDGTSVLIRSAEDTSLPPAPTYVAGPTCREAVWGVRDTATLERIGAELSSDRQVRRDATGVLHTTDDEGLAIAFQVTRRHSYVAKPALQNVPGLPPQRPMNHRVDFANRGSPRTIGHIVYWSDDPDRSMKFYVDRLGFRVTDHVTNKSGVFARAAGSHDHHNLFFLGRPDLKPSFQHIECHFADFHEVVIGGMQLNKKGWETARGPGRHVLGSNYFWYFVTPMGGAFELSADIDQVDDNWVTGEWNTLGEVSGWLSTMVG